jgi:hypothetical protein
MSAIQKPEYVERMNACMERIGPRSSSLLPTNGQVGVDFI